LIQIAIASAKDIETLARVEIESKLRSFPGHIDMAEVEYTNRMSQWTSYFNGETPVSARPERIVFKATKGEKIVGLVACHLTNRYSKDSEIQKFYVLKDEQRKGIGTELLRNLLVWLSKHGAKSLCVGIDHENLYQKFYLKYGGLHLNPHWIYWDDLNEIEERLGTIK